MTNVRGHFRRTKSGQTIWVRSYTRGKITSGVHVVTPPPLSVKLRFVRDTTSLDSLLEIVNAGDVKRRIIEAIGERLIDELDEESGKFARTQNLRLSFYLSWINEGNAEVASSVPYAKVWTHDNPSLSPPAQNIREWMRNVDDFNSGKTERELRNIAWAIRYSLVTGVGAGRTGKSVLRKLDPVGERYFDYVKEAMRKVEPFVLDVGRLFAV